MDWLKCLSHSEHLYGFSPLWILLCTARFGDWLNRLPQTLHSNGFSPEWHRLWTINERLRWKHFPHSLHLYLLLCTFICDHRDFGLWKHFSHWVHEYQSSSVRLFRCPLKTDLAVNLLSGSVHKQGLCFSSCVQSFILLLPASVFNSNKLPTHAQHKTVKILLL